VLFLVLRITIVRLVFGAAQFDWEATVLTGRTLAFFSISIFAQALIYLISRGFMHSMIQNTACCRAISTTLMIFLGAFFIFVYKTGVESIAFAFSIASVTNFLIMFILLDRKVGGLKKKPLVMTITKIFLASALPHSLYIFL